MSVFHERVKDLCAKNDITVSNLEKAINLKNSTSSNWIKRIPQGETVLKVSNYFNVSTDYLMGKTDDPTPLGNTLSKEMLYIMGACNQDPELLSILYQLIKKVDSKD